MPDFSSKIGSYLIIMLLFWTFFLNHILTFLFDYPFNNCDVKKMLSLEQKIQNYRNSKNSYRY